ncbi:MAG: cytochrome b/b6 domain-containing protein [Acidobacteriota bacterium]|nr:cytochrome b/b6 domain-containing protein [Acidobacteriota bacterium]
MKTSPIPDHPLPLSGEQAEAMRNRHLKKHHIAIILLHWFNALVWSWELTTGVVLISAERLRVVPPAFIRTITDLAGSRGNLMRIHLGIGLLWIGVFLAYGLFGWRTYLSQEVLRREIALDADDLAWLRIRALGILGRSKEPLPPQGVYNAGQKLFALLVYATLPVIMATGVIMAFHLFGAAVVGWAALIHFCAVGAVFSGLIIHVYMGAVFPEEKPAFFSMFSGVVDEVFAYSHHFKWWREMKLKEQAWEARHDQAAHTPAPGADETPSF